MTYACPTPIRHTKPGRTLNNAEAGFVRLIYDPWLPVGADLGSTAGIDRIALRSFALHSPPPGRYADGTRITLNDWAPSVAAAIRDLAADSVVVFDDGIRVDNIDGEVLRDALESHVAIPFRDGSSGQPLDTDFATSGTWQVRSAEPARIVLDRNPYHEPAGRLERLAIVEESDPGCLINGFADGALDVIALGGDLKDRLRTSGGPPDGRIISSSANAVSFFYAKPLGALSDPELRHQVAASIPRRWYRDTFLGIDGEAAYGLTAPSRGDHRLVAAETTTGAPSSWTAAIEVIVPPSRLTATRAEALIAEMVRRSGLRYTMTVADWPDYWRAVRDPTTGDLVWTGFQADRDTVRDWVRYNLLAGHIHLPAEFDDVVGALRAAEPTDAELVAFEQSMLRADWILPLYRHHQSYLVRRDIKGLLLDPADWPLPSARYHDGLTG